MTLIDFFGTLAFVTSIIGLVPQILKSYKTKSTKDISFLMLLNYAVCAAVWVIYGTFISSSFVVWSNAVALLSSIVSIIQKYIYDKKGL